MFFLRATLGKWCFSPQSVTPPGGRDVDTSVFYKDLVMEEAASLVNAGPTALLQCLVRAWSCQQDSRPVILHSFKGIFGLSYTFALYITCHHKALCPICCSMTDWCRQASVSGGVLLFDQEWRLWAMRACQKYNPSLPCDSCERNHRQSRGEKIGRTEMLMNKGANEVECET